MNIGSYSNHVKIWQPVYSEEYSCEEKTESDCFVCRNSLRYPPTDPNLVPVEHQGHSRAHLSCLLEWMKTSDLCAFCQVGLNNNQLILLLDSLKKRDLSTLHLEDFVEEAKNAANYSETNQGQIKAAYLVHCLARDVFRSIASELENPFRDYKAILEKEVYHLKRFLASGTKEEYFREKQIIQEIDPENFSETKKIFKLASKEAFSALKKYTEECRVYVLKELVFKGKLTPFALDSIPIKNPLFASLEEEMKQKAQELDLFKDQFHEMLSQIKKLEDLEVRLNERVSSREVDDVVFFVFKTYLTVFLCLTGWIILERFLDDGKTLYSSSRSDFELKICWVGSVVQSWISNRMDVLFGMSNFSNDETVRPFFEARNCIAMFFFLFFNAMSFSFVILYSTNKKVRDLLFQNTLFWTRKSQI